jgi:protein-tyrosine-phosphatase
MRLLFICRGGVFRSRVAQAIAEHNYPGQTFISSGIDAQSNLFGDISAHCEYILKKHHLLASTQPSWLQTNQGILDSAETIFFMSPDVYEDTLLKYEISKPFYVWNIEDVEIPRDKTPEDYDQQLETIFQKIKIQIQNLDM